MALTVRYPNGQAITYNSANFVERYGDCCRLLTENNGRIVALVQAGGGVVVEFDRPCNIENPLTAVSVKAAAHYLMDFAEGPQDYATTNALADLKRRLQSFNSKTRTWRKSK